MFEVSHSVWVNWIYTSFIIHKTNESFNYRNLFLYDSIRFLTQLYKDSCQSLLFLWFCPPIPKFALTLIKQWGNNIASCQCIKERESSTLSLAKFFSDFVDVVEPVWDCTAQTGDCLRLHCSNTWTLHGQNFPQVDDMQSVISQHRYRQFLQRIVLHHFSHIGLCGEPTSDQLLLQY